jgi:hypothetical protein
MVALCVVMVTAVYIAMVMVAFLGNGGRDGGGGDLGTCDM